MADIGESGRAEKIGSAWRLVTAFLTVKEAALLACASAAFHRHISSSSSDDNSCGRNILCVSLRLPEGNPFYSATFRQQQVWICRLHSLIDIEISVCDREETPTSGRRGLIPPLLALLFHSNAHTLRHVSILWLSSPPTCSITLLPKIISTWRSPTTPTYDFQESSNASSETIISSLCEHPSSLFDQVKTFSENLLPLVSSSEMSLEAPIVVRHHLRTSETSDSKLPPNRNSSFQLVKANTFSSLGSLWGISTQMPVAIRCRSRSSASSVLGKEVKSKQCGIVSPFNCSPQMPFRWTFDLSSHENSNDLSGSEQLASARPASQDNLCGDNRKGRYILYRAGSAVEDEDARSEMKDEMKDSVLLEENRSDVRELSLEKSSWKAVIDALPSLVFSECTTLILKFERPEHLLFFTNYKFPAVKTFRYYEKIKTFYSPCTSTRPLSNVLDDVCWDSAHFSTLEQILSSFHSLAVCELSVGPESSVGFSDTSVCTEEIRKVFRTLLSSSSKTLEILYCRWMDVLMDVWRSSYVHSPQKENNPEVFSYRKMNVQMPQLKHLECADAFVSIFNPSLLKFLRNFDEIGMPKLCFPRIYMSVSSERQCYSAQAVIMAAKLYHLLESQVVRMRLGNLPPSFMFHLSSISRRSFCSKFLPAAAVPSKKMLGVRPSVNRIEIASMNSKHFEKVIDFLGYYYMMYSSGLSLESLNPSFSLNLLRVTLPPSAPPRLCYPLPCFALVITSLRTLFSLCRDPRANSRLRGLIGRPAPLLRSALFLTKSLSQWRRPSLQLLEVWLDCPTPRRISVLSKFWVLFRRFPRLEEIRVVFRCFPPYVTQDSIFDSQSPETALLTSLLRPYKFERCRERENEISCTDSPRMFVFARQVTSHRWLLPNISGLYL